MGFFDVGELLSSMKADEIRGSLDEKLREMNGGGGGSEINAHKRAALSLREEAARHRCPPSGFVIDFITVYGARCEEKGWRRAQRELEEKDESNSALTEKVTHLEEEIRGLTRENSSLKEELRAVQVERERILVRVEEREKAAEGRLQEMLAVQNELRRTVEQVSVRGSVQDQALRDAASQLDQAKAEVNQLSAKSQELIKELASAREELTALRVQREADLGRLREYQAETAHIKTRESSREDEIRRLNEELRTAERREIEANQRANSLQLEAERLRGQFESGKTRPKSETKNGK